MPSHVLGIDLGTTNSVVAYADETRVRVLRDEDGRLLTPSIVAFPPTGEVVVGRAARTLRLRDPRSTVYSVKRLIGRPYDTPLVTAAAQHLPFVLEKGPTGGVAVRVRGRSLSLPEVSSFILRRLRQIAERSMRGPCAQAVITVPANFNELQRTATRDAARIAGLEVLRIINEPTAAALAYGYRSRQTQRIAVYDFGGGTFDISILELCGDVIEVVTTAGDTSLGGDDLDAAIADHLGRAYELRFGVPVAANQHARARLLLAAERLKRRLSRHTAAEISVHSLAGTDGQRRNLPVSIDRSDIEVWVDPLIERTFESCEQALRSAAVRPTQLDAVILVGGQTRTPRVRERVRDYFGIEPQCALDPDLAVAQGAALQGYALSGSASLSNERGVRSLAAVALDTASISDDSEHDLDAESAPLKLELSPDAHGAAVLDDEPTIVARRAAGAASPESQLPNIRTERPDMGLTQTLSGVGSQADPDSRADARRARDERARSTQSTQGTHPLPGRSASRGSSQSGAGFADLAFEPETARYTPLSALEGTLDAADTDLPPALRLRSDEDENEAAAPPPESPRAPSSPTAGSSLRGPVPGKPRVAIVPGALHDAHGSGVSPVERAVQGPQLADLSEALEGHEPAPVASSLDSLEEELSLTSPLPPELWSMSPDAGSQLPAPRSQAPLLLDVTPHTLNVETVDGFCEPLIERNAPIPTEQTRIFTTSQDQQAVVSVRVSQGESRHTDANHVLGQIELVGLRPASRGEVSIAVTFLIDADGTLSARALDEGTGRSQELRVRLTGAIDPADIELMRRERRSRVPT